MEDWQELIAKRKAAQDPEGNQGAHKVKLSEAAIKDIVGNPEGHSDQMLCMIHSISQPTIDYHRARASRPEEGFDPESGLAGANGHDQSTFRLLRTSYSHDAMIDIIIANPRVQHKELAATFGYSQTWVSRVIGSDAFQARLAARKSEIVDPFITATIEERLRGLAIQSLEVVSEKLAAAPTLDGGLKALELATKSLGFGARDRGGPAVQANFVIQMPGKARSAEEWADAYAPRAAGSGASSNSPTTITASATHTGPFMPHVEIDPTAPLEPMRLADG